MSGWGVDNPPGGPVKVEPRAPQVLKGPPDWKALDLLDDLNKLHSKVNARWGWDGQFNDFCSSCRVLWPCNTATLLARYEQA